MKIDAETHYFDRAYVELLRARAVPPREELLDNRVRVFPEPSAPDISQLRSRDLEDALAEVGDERVRGMDEAGIALQILSLNIPGCEQFEPAEGAGHARTCNDALAEIVARHPNRFVGLASLCPDPDAPDVGADELERAVRDLGFRGWKVNSHIRDTFLDDPRYRPILDRAAALEVPIYIHPTIPHIAMVQPYTGYGYMLPGPALGFGAETCLHAMRLIYSGVFDEHPGLCVVLGHLGEGLYWWLQRLDLEFTRTWLTRDSRIKCEQPPSYYLRKNFYAITSGHRQSSAFLATFLEAGADRLLFGTDFPYGKSQSYIDWIDSQPISPADKEKIFHLNATSLFRLDHAG